MFKKTVSKIYRVQCLVSRLSKVGIIRIIAPIIILIPSATGISSFETLDMKYNAINGDHEPKINPALYENPAALFRICVGNLSEKHAEIGPDAVDITNAYTTTYNIQHTTYNIKPYALFSMILANGIETKIDAKTKISIDFFRPNLSP